MNYKVPNNQVGVSQRLQSKLGSDYRCGYDDGNVHVNLPDGMSLQDGVSLVDQLLSQMKVSSVGDGVQQGSVWVHLHDGSDEDDLL